MKSKITSKKEKTKIDTENKKNVGNQVVQCKVSNR